MAKVDDGRLAAALRDNLRRRKERMRAARDGHEPIDTFGSDEEGDVPPPEAGALPGAWVSIGSKRDDL